jgi:hypothetical protein
MTRNQLIRKECGVKVKKAAQCDSERYQRWASDDGKITKRAQAMRRCGRRSAQGRVGHVVT